MTCADHERIANWLREKKKWEDEPLVLFVEGYSDLTFYAEVMEYAGYQRKDYFIQDMGTKGRKRLIEETQLLLKPDNLVRMQSVAVILDADGEAAGAFEMARDALKTAIGVAVPEKGVWFQPPDSKTQFGIFIVGDGRTQVEIESLVWAAWSGEQRNAGLRGCVEEFVECAAKNGLKLKSQDKVRIGALLSVLNEDDPRMGPGARARHFDLAVKEFAPLVCFLAEMKRRDA